ncbi:AraC family transcriptional regulator [Lacrimispora celerecrescens]|uniref:AraC family transcriptional regulator n=2 Tax=Lacrimispora celerecrescens TaxID=29354 RepID=A0A084JPK7_9FIRM|nr:YeiH family protein [Lacrimispora celerecrescens]KEZ90891.1 AraC family transcriptional regulator [Lacrimispora celerecrescens]
MKKYASGVLLCLIISAPAWFLGKAFPVIGGPVFAILIGMAMAPFVKGKDFLRPGVTFTSKKILQYAVIVLGFSMNLATVVQKGREALPIILATITTSLVIAFILSRALKLPGKTSILIGVGSSICGGSAIAATAPVIDADDSEIAQSISVIFFFNIIAALLFPALGSALGLSNEGFGLFAGTAINDTSSVTAAASAWDGMHGSNTLEAATIVKLTRTLAIIPITLFLACYRTGKEKKASERSISIQKVFPTFVLFFLLASIITTVFPIPVSIVSSLKDLSKLFIIMAMGAIGTNTDLIKLIRTGKKPLLLGFCCWLGISVVSLVLQVILGIW